jgi:hypothetical protein
MQILPNSSFEGASSLVDHDQNSYDGGVGIPDYSSLMKKGRW